MIKLSEYSIHFKNLSEHEAIQNSNSLENKLEEFRLKLDLRFLQKFVKKGTILDFPIGTGRIYKNFLNTHEVWGYDICKEYIKLAKQRNPEISPRFKISFLESIKHKKKFDNVITLRVLGAARNIQDLDKIFLNIHNILNKGGRFLFNMPIEIDELQKYKNFNKFKIIFKENYDFHTRLKSMEGAENRLYSFIRKNISYFPFFLLNFNEFFQIKILKKSGTNFYVVEKT